MAYQKPDLKGAIQSGLQARKTLAELDKLDREAAVERGLRDAFSAPVKSTSPQTMSIDGSEVNLGTTARAPTKEESLARAYRVDPEKTSRIEEYMSKSSNYSAETKKLDLQIKELSQLSQFSKMAHALDAYENSGKDMRVALQVLKQYDPNDDTFSIEASGKPGEYIIKDKGNPQGYPVNKKQISEAAIPLLDKYKEQGTNERFYANLDRLIARDDAAKAAKAKAAKAASPGMAKQTAIDLENKLSRLPGYEGLTTDDYRTMAIDIEEYMNQMIKENPDMSPTERRLQATELVVSRIQQAQYSGLFGAIPPGMPGSQLLDIGKPNIPASYSRDSSTISTEEKEKQNKKEPLPEGLSEETVQQALKLAKERNTGDTRESIIARYKAKIKKNN